MNYNIINWIIMVYYIYIYIFIISSYILIMDIYGLLLHGNIYIYGTHNMKILMEMWSLLCGKYDYSWKYVEMWSTI